VLLDMFTRMTWDVTLCKCPHPEDQFLSQGRQYLLLEIAWLWHITAVGLSGHMRHCLIFQQEEGWTRFYCYNLHVL